MSCIPIQSHLTPPCMHVCLKLSYGEDFGLATKKENVDLISAVDSEISPYSLLYTY